jgi:ABC-type iron transport system FetAB ATPase subunit
MLDKISVVYNNRSISLESITTLAVLGDNGVGKTAFLERIALVNEDNISVILNAKGNFSYEKFSVNIDGEEKRCKRASAERVLTKFGLNPYINWVPLEGQTYICEGNIRYKISIVYPYTFQKPIHNEHYGLPVKPDDEVMKFNEMIKGFIDGDGIVIPFYSYYGYLDFTYQSGDNVTYLDNLGRGVGNLVKLMWLVYRHRPDILLIDDIETLGLSPKRLKMFLKWFVEYIRENKLKAMLFTTNSDAYTYLAEVDENAKFLLLQKDNHIVIDREEVLNRRGVE